MEVSPNLSIFLTKFHLNTLLTLIPFIDEENISNYDQQDQNSSHSKDSKGQDKRVKRLLQNRKSASKLRVKKKEHYKQLEIEEKTLSVENTRLRKQVRLLFGSDPIRLFNIDVTIIC